MALSGSSWKFTEEQSRANIYVRSAVTSYWTGFDTTTTTTVHQAEGLDGIFDPELGVGGFAEKRQLETGEIIERYSEQVLTHLGDGVPMTWTLTIEVLDLNDFTTTTRTDVVTLVTTTTYTLRCTDLWTQCSVLAVELTLPV